MAPEGLEEGLEKGSIPSYSVPCRVFRPYRLAWSRTQDSQSWNSGSNPDGVTQIEELWVSSTSKCNAPGLNPPPPALTFCIYVVEY